MLDGQYQLKMSGSFFILGPKAEPGRPGFVAG